MQTKVMKWGNSLAIRIPKSLAKSAKINEGNEISMKSVKNKILLQKVHNKSYSLKSLLSKINSNNIHKEINTGDAVGKEIW